MCFPMLLCENVIPQVSNETEIGVDQVEQTPGVSLHGAASNVIPPPQAQRASRLGSWEGFYLPAGLQTARNLSLRLLESCC